jgi:hypothetical protein
MAPNAASGGFQGGCLSWKYQASKTVSHEPMPATAKLTTNATSKLRQWVLMLGELRLNAVAALAEPVLSKSFIVFYVLKGFP